MDKTKQKIQELLPEIMELKFGCRVVTLPFGIGVPEDDHMVHTITDISKMTSQFRSVEWNRKISISSISDVLGRPIQLFDVLRAMRKYSVPGAAGQTTIIHQMRETDLLKVYDLSKDYDGQSVETKNFIGSLLGVE